MNKHYTFMMGLLLLAGLGATAQHTAHFDSLFQSTNQYLDGSGAEARGAYQSANVRFSNVYQTQYGGFWSDGWAISNITNDTTAGFTNLYASYANGAQSGQNYWVGQSGSVIVTTGGDAGKTIKGLYVTNGTYPALSMLNGDQFAKQFGGVSGNDPDFFALSVFAYKNGVKGTDSVAFYLADYRNSDNAQDYIVKQWTYLDLTSLGAADSIVFALSSSDNGQFGMNTPAFFCVDDVVTDSDTADAEEWALRAQSFVNRTDAKLNSVVAQGPMLFPSTYTVSRLYNNYWSAGFAPSSMVDTTTAGFTNLFSAYAGEGANGSLGYAIAQQRATIKLGTAGAKLQGVYISNATYTALSMRDGDSFAKKFGGVSGNDSDWFKVSFVGYHQGVADTVVAYLADFRFADNSQDYIVKAWNWVDLSALGVCDSLRLVLTSSDVGQFGMNTPGFMAIDELTVSEVTGLFTAQSELPIAVFPNPVTDVLTVDAGSQAIAVTVLDLTGKVVLQAPVAHAHQLDMRALPAGVYLLQAQSTMGVSTQKIVKQ